MTSREIIRILEENGWRRKNIKGDHHQFIHPGKPGKVTVPHPAKDLKKGTVNSILRQAGLK
ncbi:MAG TPA: type II toxin-antitoxin system HicA family toxin [Candidatus Hydrogenedentes bacterium]|nr:type II toxin-antitoxin system HicA family toxin [Candidatus Hydrogenedentota bacterium]